MIRHEPVLPPEDIFPIHDWRVVESRLNLNKIAQTETIFSTANGYFGMRGNDAWIEEVMENLELTAKANANMRSLSGGMKRRVLIAQALVHKPPVIILDEPTAGVDVELRQGLWQFVSRLNRDGHTVVFSTIKGRLKTRNMMRDPRVSLLVIDREEARYVEIRGTVEITEDPEKRLLYEMYDRYMAGVAPPPEPDAERLIVRITPDKIYQFPPAAA